MSKWKMVRLGDVCAINMGQSPSSESYNEEKDGIPFYQGNADFGEIHPNVRFYCNKPTKIAHKNDVLLSVRAPIGAINIATEKCCIGRGLCAITEKENVSYYKYIYYVLKKGKSELIAKGTGSTFKAINKANLLDIRIPLPPLDVQKHIADTLDKTREIIDGYEKQLEELDNLIKATFYEMFGDPVANGSGWKKVLIEEAYEIIDGDRGVNYPKQDDFSNKGYCVFLNTGNVTTDGFNFDKVQYISMEKDKQLRKGKLSRGDIVFTTRGTVGNIAFYNNTIPYNIVRINSGMVLLRNKSYLSHPVFFCHLFRNPSMIRYYETFLSGTAQPQLPITNLRKIKVILPPIDLQEKFTEIVTKIEEQKAIVKQAITESENLFNSLMSEYFD